MKPYVLLLTVCTSIINSIGVVQGSLFAHRSGSVKQPIMGGICDKQRKFVFNTI